MGSAYLGNHYAHNLDETIENDVSILVSEDLALQAQPDCITTNPLLRRLAFESMAEEMQKRVAGKALRIMATALVKLNKPSKLEQRLETHVVTCIDWIHTYFPIREATFKKMKMKAEAWMTLGRACMAHGRHQFAEELLDLAQKYMRKHEEANLKSRLLFQVGCNFLSSKRFWEAEEQLRLALAEATSRPSNIWIQAEITEKLAEVCTKQGCLDEAENYLRQTIQLYEELHGLNDPKTLDFVAKLAVHYSEKRQYERSEMMLQRTLLYVAQKFGLQSRVTMEFRRRLAGVYQKQGRLDEAEDLLRPLYNADIERLSKNHPQVLHRQVDLADLLKKKGQFEDAEALYREVLKKIQTMRKKHPSEVDVLESLADNKYLRWRSRNQERNLLIEATSSYKDLFAAQLSARLVGNWSPGMRDKAHGTARQG